MPFPAGPSTSPDPGTGLCAAWIPPTDVQNRPGCGQISEPDAEKAALIASELLYWLSGRQYNGGGCQATVRPTATPAGWNPAAWAAMYGGAWSAPAAATWGVCTAVGSALDHRSCPSPPQIRLGATPVTAILSVKVDGQVIPPGEYTLLGDGFTLLRTRTGPAAQPTARPGWPVCQDLTLPDSEPGTFSVTYTYGVPPPAAGQHACAVLAAEIALEQAGQGSGKLPARVTDLARQGVSIKVGDPLPSLTDRLTGIPAVDRFLIATNPARLSQRAQVWSPDVGRPIRTG